MRLWLVLRILGITNNMADVDVRPSVRYDVDVDVTAARNRRDEGPHHPPVLPRQHQPALQQLGQGPGKSNKCANLLSSRAWWLVRLPGVAVILRAE